METLNQNQQRLSARIALRRHFFARSSASLASLALGSLLLENNLASENTSKLGILPEIDGLPHFPPKVKRVIYLFQAGGPAQMELFDHKPMLKKYHGQALPDSVRGNQRLTGMSSSQASIPLAGCFAEFSKQGTSGVELSNLLPHHAKIADNLCVLRGVYTDAINHDPAITFFQTGSQIAGRPCLGSWLSYGLGSENANLPAFIVMVSENAKKDQPLYSRLWSSGFLNSRHEGVQFLSGASPVPFLNNPDGVSSQSRRALLDSLGDLNRTQHERELDPEILSRIAQYEMAFRMQSSVPEATRIEDESEATLEMYGPDSKKPGTYAANCLMARRLAERGVRFIQLYHQGWDHHENLPPQMRAQCKQVDQPSAALVMDLKQRGMLDDTLVIFGGEFGRTSYSQGVLAGETYGRDHHSRCMSLWIAGGGIRSGTTYGQTDEFSFNVTDGAVHVHDLHATIMHLLGIDHERLTFKYQGRRFRLTDVHGRFIQPILS
jgi:hypothetical protein